MSQELSSNTTLSHYRIVAKLGAGGRSEVYRASAAKSRSKCGRLNSPMTPTGCAASRPLRNEALRPAAAPRDDIGTSTSRQPQGQVTLFDPSSHVISQSPDGSECAWRTTHGPAPTSSAAQAAHPQQSPASLMQLALARSSSTRSYTTR